MQKFSLFFGSLFLMGLWVCNNEGDGDIIIFFMDDIGVNFFISIEIVFFGFNYFWGMMFLSEDIWFIME